MSKNMIEMESLEQPLNDGLSAKVADTATTATGYAHGKSKRRAIMLTIAAVFLIFSATIVVCLVLLLSQEEDAELPQSITQRKLYAFTLLAPRDVSPSQLVARVLVPRPTNGCPVVSVTFVNGTTRHMETVERKPPSTVARAFSDFLVCSAPLPDGSIAATVAGQSIPASIAPAVSLMAMFSDTGCRIEPNRVQNCNDAYEWPIARIAAKAAAMRPDVFLIPGDYIYHESACPENELSKCRGAVAPVTGMPFDDSSAGWEQEVFEPYSSIFNVAPIAFLRGNHEACNRAGIGFFLYLDPRPNTENTCSPSISEQGLLVAAINQTTPTWHIDIPVGKNRTLRIAMVDSAYGYDRTITPWWTSQRVSYVEAANLTASRLGLESWLMTHRPIFGILPKEMLPPNDTLAEPWTSDAQSLASYGLLSNYDMILSSHMHLLQSVQIPGQPGHLIIGNGGTMLDKPFPVDLPPYGPLAKGDGSPLATGFTPYPTAQSVWTRYTHGFMVAQPGREAGSWNFTHLNQFGQLIGRCALSSRSIACIP